MNAPVAAVTAIVALGGNEGDAVAVLRAALVGLDLLPGTRLLRASRLYRTPAWGRTDQPDFINAAAALETTLAARELLDRLDLDVLLYGDAVIDEPGLHVPHPHLHERAFALVPLLDVAPDAVIPGIGPAREVLGVMATDAIEVVG